MNNHLYQKAGMILSLAIVGNLTAGCRADLSTASGITSGSGSTVDVGAGATTASGTASNDAFWVKPYFDPKKPNEVYSFYLHEQSSSYGSANCQVAAGSATNDIYCYLDVNELDLIFNGVSLDFNAPVGMCSYTSLKPYAFYFLPAGYFSPPAITIAKDTSGAVTGVTFTSGGAAVPAAGATAVAINAGGTAPVCPFDYTEAGGPNCCEGNYTVTVTQAAVAPAPPTTTTVDGKFGGKVSNCIVGPGKDFRQSANGYPVEEISRTSLNGGNELVQVTSPLKKSNLDGSPYSGNIYPANYFNPTSFGFVGVPTWPVPKANWPRAISGDLVGAPAVLVGTKSYSFSDGTSYMTASGSLNPYYEYACLDSDYDVLARIRLFVNSWDTLAGWTSTSGPYSGGAEAGFPEYPKHDFAVWEDFVNTFPGLTL
jgi:hypothetical protein